MSTNKNGHAVDLNDLNNDLNSDSALLDTVNDDKMLELDQPNDGLPMEDTLMHDIPDMGTNLNHIY